MNSDATISMMPSKAMMPMKRESIFVSIRNHFHPSYLEVGYVIAMNY